MLLSVMRADINSHSQTLLDLDSGSSLRTIARAHNDGSLKLTQMAQDVISNSPLNVFENDSGSTGVAVLPNPTVNETKVRMVVL